MTRAPADFATGLLLALASDRAMDRRLAQRKKDADRLDTIAEVLGMTQEPCSCGFLKMASKRLNEIAVRMRGEP